MADIVQIQALTSTGEGVGSLGELKIFIEGALPEERVEVKIVENKKKYLKGSLLSILDPSSLRVSPPCPLFGKCGGCQLMHLSYEGQLEIKRKRVVDALERIGKFQGVTVQPCIPSPKPLHYRNKIQLPVIWSHGKKTIGLYKKDSHEVIPLEACLIQCEQGEEIRKAIFNHLDHPSVRHILIRTSLFKQESLVMLVTDGKDFTRLQTLAQTLLQLHPTLKGVVENINTRSDNVILGTQFRLLAGRPFIYESLLGTLFKISPSSFFQVNPEQAQQLYCKALELADIEPEDRVLDAYCGVGALALLSAKKARQVFGIECVKEAIENARENSLLNNQENTTFLCGKAEALITTLPFCHRVFLNPPRKGCEESLLQVLLKQAPKTIIYLSCDPATLARDLKILSSSYTLESVHPFDMFPQTTHVETIAKLSLNK